MFSLQGAQVQSLARELRLHMPHSVVKKKKKNVIKTCTLEQELLKFSVPQFLPVNVN